MHELPQSTKFLINKAEILNYCRVSDYVFQRLIRAGLPARYEPGAGWFAHTDNLDQWLAAWTRVSVRAIIDTIPENGQ